MRLTTEEHQDIWKYNETVLYLNSDGYTNVCAFQKLQFSTFKRVNFTEYKLNLNKFDF